MFLVIAMQILYGSTIPLNKFLLSMCAPIYLSGLRMTLAGAVILIGVFFFSYKRLRFKKNHLWLYIQAAVIGIYAKYILRNISLSHMPAVKMGFLLSGAPFISMLFSYFFFGQKHSKKQWLGLLIGFAGLAPVIILKAASEKSSQQLFAISLSELLCFAAIVCHIYGMVLVKKLINLRVSSIVINGVQMFTGGTLALATGIIFEGWFPITNAPVFGRWLVGLIILSNIVFHTGYVELLKRYSVSFVSFTDCLSPLVTAFLGWLFLHEQITWHYAIAALFLFIGLYLFHQDEMNFKRKKVLKFERSV